MHLGRLLKTINCGMRYLGTGAKNEHRPEVLTVLVIKLTTRCNARCTICTLANGNKTYSHQDLPQEMAHKLISQLQKTNTLLVGFTGGEPLLYEPLPEIIRKLTTAHIHTHICTNAQLIDRSMARLLGQAGLTSASISLDHPHPDINDSIRAGTKHSRVVSAVSYMQQEAKNTRLSLGMTVTRHNLSAIEQMVGFANSIGINYLKLQPYHTNLEQHIKPSTQADSLCIRDKDLPVLLENLHLANSLSLSQGVMTNIPMLLTELPNSIYGIRRLRCLAGRMIAFMDQTGRLGACPGMLGDKKFTDNSLLDLWNDSVMEAASNCPQLPRCFDTTYGELSYLMSLVSRPRSRMLQQFWTRFKTWG